jgi:predicted nucleic acid-binding Zn ribbon protein
MFNFQLMYDECQSCGLAVPVGREFCDDQCEAEYSGHPYWDMSCIGCGGDVYTPGLYFCCDTCEDEYNGVYTKTRKAPHGDKWQ